MLNTIVMTPTGVGNLSVRVNSNDKLKLTTGSPRLRSLLQLEKHVTTVVIVVEVVNVIND